MSQTIIPLEFERYLQDRTSSGKAPDMNEMIFAYIPGLDPSVPISRENGICDESLWVHQQAVTQVGKLGDNALVYSVVVLGDKAEFTFNAIYLRDKFAPDSCGMVVHKAEETKENGMAITKSLVQEYTGAAKIANITVDASTWQIDYQARLCGIEEDHRLACFDTYGHTAYLDGFDVTQQAELDKYLITPGVVYIGGLRTVLSDELLQTIVTKPNGLYIDVVRQGAVTSKWENKPTIILSETEKADYIDEQGQQHYVARLAGINADGSVTDWRVGNKLQELLESDDPFPQYVKEDEPESSPFWSKVSDFVLNKLWLALANKICPVGVPLPWPTDVAPDGFAIYKGQAFDTDANPETAKVYPDGILPDMRGLAIVGKEDNELILAYEEGQVKSHNHDGSVADANLGSLSSTTNGEHYHYDGVRYHPSDSATALFGHTTTSGGQANGALYSVSPGLKYRTSTVNGHTHSIALGSHAHALVIAAFGAVKNTINHRKFNWITRLA